MSVTAPAAQFHARFERLITDPVQGQTYSPPCPQTGIYHQRGFAGMKARKNTNSSSNAADPYNPDPPRRANLTPVFRSIHSRYEDAPDPDPGGGIGRRSLPLQADRGGFRQADQREDGVG